MIAIRKACLFAAAAAMLTTGCEQPRVNAEGLVREIGADTLRREGAILYKNLFAGPGAAVIGLKQAEWPASFARLQPLHVVAYRDGFTIALVKDGNTESGVFVVPHEMDRMPESTHRATFARIEEGVFWYFFADPFAPRQSR